MDMGRLVNRGRRVNDNIATTPGWDKRSFIHSGSTRTSSSELSSWTHKRNRGQTVARWRILLMFFCLLAPPPPPHRYHYVYSHHLSPSLLISFASFIFLSSVYSLHLFYNSLNPCVPLLFPLLLYFHGCYFCLSLSPFYFHSLLPVPPPHISSFLPVRDDDKMKSCSNLGYLGWRFNLALEQGNKILSIITI